MSAVYVVIADNPEIGADVEIFGSKKRAEDYAVKLARNEGLKVSIVAPNFRSRTGELITIDGLSTGISVVEKEIRRVSKSRQEKSW